MSNLISPRCVAKREGREGDAFFNCISTSKSNDRAPPGDDGVDWIFKGCVVCTQLFSWPTTLHQHPGSHPLQPSAGRKSKGILYHCLTTQVDKSNVLLSPLEIATGLIVAGEIRYFLGLSHVPYSQMQSPQRMQNCRKWCCVIYFHNCLDVSTVFLNYQHHQQYHWEDN